jgi:hypothetical protein
MTEPERHPTVGEIADAFDEHQRQEAERIRALDAFISDGMPADMAAVAQDAWRQAHRTGKPAPTITGKPALEDVNSRV